MISTVAFTISIIAAIMSFFSVLRLPSFVIAIFGIIFATAAGYQKEKKQNKDDKKQSMAVEIGTIIISGAVCISYLIILWFTK